ncbi:MAG: insulinase family protein [Bacteroidota bacterium]|nr:insulinase family protein [Bacteroidota bacterium]
MKEFALSLIVLFSAPALIFAQAKLVEKVVKKGNEIVIPFEKYILPNGLTVIISEDHSDPIVHVDVTYHVGSAREEIGKSGFAHFFEHMMFEGSDHVADKQHFKVVTESGGTLNGSTNTDRTNYFETVPSNQLEKMLWLESDRMGFLVNAVTQPKFEIQRSTVKNERGQNYDNRPYGLAGEVASKALYPYGHPYSWLTIGYVEDLNRVNVNDLKNFFLRWYGPNNATLTIGGDVNTKDVIRMVEKYFGSIPRGPEVKPVQLPPVKLTKKEYVSYVDNYAKLPMLTITYPTVPNYNADMAPLACLAQVLGQGRTSALYQNMVKPQKALQASAYSSLDELAGTFNIRVIPLPGATLADMEKLVDESLKDFEKKGVTNDDIEKFKNGFESNTINRLASVAGKASQLAAFETFTGNPNMIGKLLAMYNKVTKEDVMRVYDKYIKNKPAVVLSVLPKGKENLIAAKDNFTIDTTQYVRPHYGYEGLKYHEPKDNFDRKLIPPSGPNPVVKVPDFWKKTLTGGITAIGVENDEIPVVNLNVYLKGGTIVEQNDLSKAGLASLFADMMSEDTKDRSSEDVNLALEKLGSSINVYSSTDAVVFSVQSLSKNLSKTLAILQERMLRPKFTEETFNRIKRQTIESIKNSKSQASSVANVVFDKINYGSNNIFGFPDIGTEQTLKNINLGDIQNYYNHFVSSDDAKVVVVGSIKENEVLPQLNFLDQLPKKTITLPTVPAAPPVGKAKIYIVNIPHAAQTEFRIGYVTDMNYDATGDYYKAGLSNYNLGGSFNSRLNIKLREDKGWTYGARSTFTGDKYTGTFYFSSGIRANATDTALTTLLTDLKNYNMHGPDKDEVAFMKSSIGQSDARNYETGGQKAAFISRILMYNLPANFVEQQTKILENISTGEIDSLAKKYYDINKMNILLVGDKDLFLPGLKDLGYDIVELDADGNKL